MTLKLTRPLIFFDIESTGLDTAKDRIIDLSTFSVNPDGTKQITNFRFNPGIPIPPSSTSIHGIKNSDVKDSPFFKDRVEEVYKLFSNCDVAGYNIFNFDIPLLVEEFLRCGKEWPHTDTKAVDAYTIFAKKLPRNLTGAYKFFCDKDLENAHSAEADIRATEEIFNSQLDKYSDIGEDVEHINQFCIEGQKPIVDYAKRLTYNEKGEVVFNFGKNKGKRVIDEREYARWMYKTDFPLNTKNALKKIFNEIDKKT